MSKFLLLISLFIFNINVCAQEQNEALKYLKAAQETVIPISEEQALEYSKALVQAQISSDASNIHLSKAFETFYLEMFLSTEFYNGLVDIQ